MPTYEYFCPDNQVRLEVMHGIRETLSTWGELCQLAECPLGETAPDSPIKKLISAPGLSFPKTNSQLKNLGFTKLVKRESGVYENVTATDSEKRYVRSDDPSSMPDFSKKIRD